MRSPILLLAAGLALIIAAASAWWYLQPAQPGGNAADLPSALPFQGPASASRPSQNTAIDSGAVDRNHAASADSPQTTAQAQAELAARNADRALFEPLPDSADAIDDYIQRQLRGPLQNGDFAQLITQSNVIDRSANVMINLAKGQIARAHLPLAPPAGKFSVTDKSEELFVPDAENQKRYLPYIEAMEKFDTATLAAFYAVMSPLLENAYRQLGEPGSFHNAMMTAFDLILATPEIDDAQITLVRPKVMYQYESAELEKLPPAQKLMLRIGSTNRQRVKSVITQWRAQLKP